jgi:hypothetical protein
MKASDWRLDYEARPKGLGQQYIEPLIVDLESLEAENARQVESHAKIIASWKREELGWDKERADLTASLAQANARLEVMRDALKKLIDSNIDEHGYCEWVHCDELRKILSAQPKGDVRERVE